LASKLTPKAFLKRARVFPNENIFAVGTFESGITIYGQQVRALNLAYALKKWKDERDGRPMSLSPPPSLAVVGGGAFGITCAAAAQQVGFSVDLFERHQQLLPLQRGCDTRWVHPHSYNWPASGSTGRYARLPILDWQAGTAAQMANQIFSQFEARRQTHQYRSPVILRCNSEVLKVSGKRGRAQVYFESSTVSEVRTYGAVVLALGFGLESGEQTDFYWRNDRLGQVEIDPSTGFRRRYVVSGTGDGGLVDLFRLTISDFDQGRFWDNWLGRHEDLIAELRHIRQASLHLKTIYDRLDRFVKHPFLGPAFDERLQELKNRGRIDTNVILSGRSDDFRGCLDLTKISFANALLAFSLYRIGAFRYQPLLEAKGIAEPGSDLDGRKFIYRHGADRYKALSCIPKRVVDRLRKRDEKGISTSVRLFPPGWWTTLEARGDYGSSKGGQRLEFIAPVTLALATVFVRSLADALRARFTVSGSVRHFRVTLHRLLELDGEDWFQQIAPYFGEGDLDGASGRIFPATGGIVGLACQTGRIVVVRSRTKTTFEKVTTKSKFKTIDAREIRKEVRAIFACPIFVPRQTSRTRDRVNLVLFADAVDERAFTDDALEMIFDMTTGFLSNLERMLEEGSIQSPLSDYSGYKILSKSAIRAKISTFRGLNTTFLDPDTRASSRKLRFLKLKWVDLEVNPFYRLE
jgi:hypothetical protein